jgi:tRNA(adenine34) deaminase
MTDAAPATDADCMAAALAEARAAGAEGEVPVGAVLVRGDRIVARGRNASIRLHDPTAHAEIVALRAAAGGARNYRLPDAALFVTVEPCLMCVGALLQARVQRVVFGCADPNRFVVERGLGAAEARALLQEFFRARR